MHSLAGRRYTGFDRTAVKLTPEYQPAQLKRSVFSGWHFTNEELAQLWRWEYDLLLVVKARKNPLQRGLQFLGYKSGVSQLIAYLIATSFQ
jgi:hypothetical protein